MVNRRPHSYRFGAVFRAAICDLHRRTEEAASAHGLTGEQYLLLLMVGAAPRGELTVSELAERLALARNGVAERVARAEQAGLVRRRRSPDDGRVTLVSLTADGEQRLAGAFRALRGNFDHFMDLMAGIDRGELDVLEPAGRARRAPGARAAA
jgi:DNA-binding MarR family transcriptional regulator